MCNQLFDLCVLLYISFQISIEKIGHIIDFFNICFIIIFLIYLCNGTDLLKFAYVNLSLCLLNLLPVMSFDGGQLLYILLSRRFTGHTAEKTVNIITFIALFPIAVLGFIILFNSDYNFSLLFVCGYIILSLIFKNNRYF